ncbi:HAD family hydrolase [Amycolatopsis sp. CA-230715]|uniref:HAD family hydrolase n=1 Tax=Amycolatopsis sp. CA-230715 TaxID=2745196 RepID=UPI001C00CA5D|nr:HAD hydrolase-like protein [Amycolatopsis sp. CA-230715]QWF83164.1 Phosphoglycolate phosphatase [Amycolatopsis sp. CA-230715]
MRAEELLTERDHVLVALDGPVAELPNANSVASRLRVLVAEGPLPRKVARTEDPFVVLAYAATIGPTTERAVYAQLCRLEAEVASLARPVPGVLDAFSRLASAGTHLTVVSSLAVETVRAFLVLNGLAEHVRHLAGRTGSDPAKLPPVSDLITAAIHADAVPVESCMFVGSTRADLDAARAAGVGTVRYRPSPPPATELPASPPPAAWLEALTEERTTNRLR